MLKAGSGVLALGSQAAPGGSRSRDPQYKATRPSKPVLPLGMMHEGCMKGRVAETGSLTVGAAVREAAVGRAVSLWLVLSSTARLVSHPSEDLAPCPP